MNFYVYILKSQKDHKYYIGQTNNLSARIERHNNGQVISTKNRKPLILIYFEEYKTRAESMRREHYLKILKGNIEFHKIIEK